MSQNDNADDHDVRGESMSKTTRRGLLGALGVAGLASLGSSGASANLGGGPEAGAMTDYQVPYYRVPERDLDTPGVVGRRVEITAGGSSYDTGDQLVDLGDRWELVSPNYESLSAGTVNHDSTPQPTATADDTAIGGLHDAEVIDGVALCADKTDGAVHAISRDGELIASKGNLGNCQTIEVRPYLGDGGAFLHGSVNGFSSHDTAYSARFDTLSTVTDTNLERINGSDYIEERDEVILGCKTGYVYVIDTSDRNNLSIVTSSDISGTGITVPHDIVRLPGGIFLVPNQEGGVTNKLGAINAYSLGSNIYKATPWSATSTITDPDLDGANRVVRGYDMTRVYVGCNKGDNILAALDTTDPTNPSVINKIQPSVGPVSGLSKNWQQSGHLLAAVGDTGYKVYNIRDDPDLTDGSVLSYDFGTSKSGHDSPVWNGEIFFQDQANGECNIQSFDPFETYGALR